MGKCGLTHLLCLSCAETASTVRVRVRGVDSRTCPFAGAITCCGSGPVSFPAPGWSRALACLGKCGGRSAETWVVCVDPKFTLGSMLTELCRAYYMYAFSVCTSTASPTFFDEGQLLEMAEVHWVRVATNFSCSWGSRLLRVRISRNGLILVRLFWLLFDPGRDGFAAM